MQTQFKDVLPNGDNITFNHSDMDSETKMSTVNINYLEADFEFHQFKTDQGVKLNFFREFHIESSNPLTAAIEQALFNYFASLCYFELCYEDGIPCLTKTIII